MTKYLISDEIYERLKRLGYPPVINDSICGGKTLCENPSVFDVECWLRHEKNIHVVLFIARKTVPSTVIYYVFQGFMILNGIDMEVVSGNTDELKSKEEALEVFIVAAVEKLENEKENEKH